jgi:phage FluMu protein Com
MEYEARKTQIGKLKRKIISGVLYALISTAFIVVIILSIINWSDEYTRFPQQIGQLWFIWGLIAIAAAIYSFINFSGWVAVKCPYCGKDEWIRRKSQNLRCRYCKGVSVRKENALETVNRN